MINRRKDIIYTRLGVLQSLTWPCKEKKKTENKKEVITKGGVHEKKTIIDIGWENIKNEKNGNENENITCFGDRTRSDTFTDNFINVFNSVISPHIFSYCCVLHYFLTMLACFNFNFIPAH